MPEGRKVGKCRGQGYVTRSKASDKAILGEGKWKAM
jgi:hypothetical protein